MSYHVPVLLQASVEGLNIKPEGTYVDVTFGGGGHSRLILEKLNEGRLIAFDQDEQAIVNHPGNENLLLINSNFRYMRNYLRANGIQQVDGILADLGVSSHQIDVPERGFSTRFEGPLDMRMDRQGGLTAELVVNEYDETKLMEVFSQYGELKNSGRVASDIVFARKQKPLKTIGEFKEILQKRAPRGQENKFYAQVFQALRIEVNGELDALKEFLLQSQQVLAIGGRLSVISYHSLEDRLVKNFMRSGKFQGEIEKDFYGNVIAPFKPIGKAIQPGEEEIAENPRSRSARLRIAEKLM
ncbi:MAG: 16S rRNA (cytosine(1402)-N(4))-methyltransferase RsmH [Bacteroidales bacterium]|nr:16S rRNA (cytosine(1402)-N(4))-methyltransferase RsmH [Bacteroidales bacterium]